MRKRISTNSPFEKKYGYSRAVVQEPFAFVSGVVGYDEGAHTLPPDIRRQTRNCWRIIAEALGREGFALADIVRATYYVTDRAYLVPVAEECGAVLEEIRPASTLMAVSALMLPQMWVEIEVTAMRQADAAG